MLTSRRIQDENSQHSTYGSKQPDQENQMSSLNVGGKAGLKSARKGLQSVGMQNLAKGPSAPRKALGDITNATPVAKTGAQLRLQQDTAQKAASALPKAQVEQSKEELWAKEGIEQMAGKGWQAMEEEQRTLQQHRIDARVQAALGRKPGGAKRSWHVSRKLPRVPRPKSRSPSPIKAMEELQLDIAALLPPEDAPPMLQCYD